MCKPPDIAARKAIVSNASQKAAAHLLAHRRNARRLRVRPRIARLKLVLHRAVPRRQTQIVLLVDVHLRDARLVVAKQQLVLRQIALPSLVHPKAVHLKPERK